MADGDDENDRTLFCGNISDRVTNDILYELFLQAGPLSRVKIPTDNMTGQQKSFAFVTFKQVVSVPYTIELMNGLHLYGKPMNLSFKKGSIHERNRQQAQFNRSVSAPNMGQFSGNTWTRPPFQGMPNITKNNSFASPGMINSPQHMAPNNFNDNRGRYNNDGRHRDNDNYDRGRHRDRESDRDRQSDRDRSRSNDPGRSSDYDRGRSRGGNDRRNHDELDRQRSYDRDQGRHSDRRGSRFDTPPPLNRQSRSEISPGMLPMMNPDPKRDIEQTRQSVIELQQQQLQFLQQVKNNQYRQQQQQQWGQGGSRQGGYRGGRW